MAIKQAMDIVVGDVLPAKNHGETGSQRVVDVRWDKTTKTIEIQMHTGDKFFYGPSEKVYFPVRPDQSSRQYMDLANPPVPQDVYPGDLLPPLEGGDNIEWFDPQRVTYVRWDGGKYLISTIREGQQRGVTYVFFKDEPIVFPHDRTKIETRGRKPGAVTGDGEIRPFGPWTHLKTGAKFMFALHPYGGGRWPSAIRPYDPQLPALPGDATYLCRFPRYDWDPDLHTDDPDLLRKQGRVKRWSRRSGIQWS